MTSYSVSQILSTFSQGETALSQVAQPIAETAFGSQLPDARAVIGQRLRHRRDHGNPPEEAPRRDNQPEPGNF